MTSPTSTLSNALSTISIAHAYRRRSSPEEASWKPKSRFWKSRFFKFSRPTHRKFSTERMFQPPRVRNILWLYTLVHTLSNALSTIFIRHLYRAVSAVKPTCKKSNLQNTYFWYFQKTHPTQEEFRHHKIIFEICNFTVNNSFLDPIEEISSTNSNILYKIPMFFFPSDSSWLLFWSFPFLKRRGDVRMLLKRVFSFW